MDKRYRIISDCVHMLRDGALPQKRRLEVEVKLIQLKVKLLKCEGSLGAVGEAVPFRNLMLLVQEFVANGQCKETQREILQCIDALMTDLQEQAAENCFKY